MPGEWRYFFPMKLKGFCSCRHECVIKIRKGPFCLLLRLSSFIKDSALSIKLKKDCRKNALFVVEATNFSYKHEKWLLKLYTGMLCTILETSPTQFHTTSVSMLSSKIASSAVLSWHNLGAETAAVSDVSLKIRVVDLVFSGLEQVQDLKRAKFLIPFYCSKIVDYRLTKHGL